MDKIRIVFLLLFSLNVGALELGPEFLTAKSYSDQYRSILVNKLKQMDQNFIRDINGPEIRYISKEDTTCLDGTKVEKNQALMRVIFDNKLKEDKYTEVRDYMGCNGKVAFQEYIEIKGINQALHNLSDFYASRLKLGAVKNYKNFEYTLFDNQGERVFSITNEVLSKENKNNSEMNFFLNNQLFFKRIINNEKWITYHSYPLSFSMNRNGYSINIKSAGRFQRPIMAHITPYNIEYYNEDQERVALAKFQENFTVNGFNFIMDSLLAYYPQTSFVTSNLQSSKLLTELRDAQTFLINGVQLNLVRNLIEEYIEAVQKGEIVDNRKK